MYFTIDKKRLRVPLKVLKTVKTKYPETKNLKDEECQKEKISVEEVTFFTSLEATSQLRKTSFCFAVSMLRDIILS